MPEDHRGYKLSGRDGWSKSKKRSMSKDDVRAMVERYRAQNNITETHKNGDDTLPPLDEEEDANWVDEEDYHCFVHTSDDIDFDSNNSTGSGSSSSSSSTVSGERCYYPKCQEAPCTCTPWSAWWFQPSPRRWPFS